jgi:hypothetical protein
MITDYIYQFRAPNGVPPNLPDANLAGSGRTGMSPLGRTRKIRAGSLPCQVAKSVEIWPQQRCWTP